jgi:23S rRNA pseudouridine2605 synthase
LKLERLHKFLARAGIGSRRKCEEFIAQGRVWVDGRVVTTPGYKIDPSGQEVRFDGRLVRPQKPLYFLVNKPPGFICTEFDPKGRKKVSQLLPTKHRLFLVGRLDVDSEGLLIATNDGEFAQRVAHPRYQVPRVYEVLLRGILSPQICQRIQKGVWLCEGKTGPISIKYVKRLRNYTRAQVTLREGMNRQVRRVFAKFGLKVVRLKRVRIGPLSIKGLPTGHVRPLTDQEIASIKG